MPPSEAAASPNYTSDIVGRPCYDAVQEKGRERGLGEGCGFGLMLGTRAASSALDLGVAARPCVPPLPATATATALSHTVSAGRLGLVKDPRRAVLRTPGHWLAALSHPPAPHSLMSQRRCLPLAQKMGLRCPTNGAPTTPHARAQSVLVRRHSVPRHERGPRDGGTPSKWLPVGGCWLADLPLSYLSKAFREARRCVRGPKPRELSGFHSPAPRSHPPPPPQPPSLLGAPDLWLLLTQSRHRAERFLFFCIDSPPPPPTHGQQPVSRTADPRSSQTGQVIQGLR